MSWIKKLIEFKIPEQWHDPDSFAFNVANLFFWAIVLGMFLFLLTRCS